jgi:hypothetical protein
VSRNDGSVSHGSIVSCSRRPHRWPPSSRASAMSKRNCSSVGAAHPRTARRSEATDDDRHGA